MFEKGGIYGNNNRIQNVEKPAQENDMVPEVCTQGKASNKAKVINVCPYCVKMNCIEVVK